jgi:ubiquinone/menaquinone biosynthesis C-methylase UbiE
MSTIICLGRINNKYTILDAGCGPGKGTKLIAALMPNQLSTLYAFDFSKDMVKLCQKEFDNYLDFNRNQYNYFNVCLDDPSDQDEKINITKDTDKIRKDRIGKVVKFFNGNIESLKFQDEQFDLYLSNLCLMLCHDYEKALRECYRVLKPGGVAVFSVWGKKEDTVLAWKIFKDVLTKFNIEFPNEKDAYHIGDSNLLKSKMEEAGFINIKSQYTDLIYDCFNEADYLVRFQGPSVNSVLDKIQDDKIVKECLETVRLEVKHRMVEQGILPSLNILVMVGFKSGE